MKQKSEPTQVQATKQNEKKKYEAPKSEKLGGFAELTQMAKGGNKNDGTGKPATRNNGSST